MVEDPYAKIATPVSAPDPYAAFAKPVGVDRTFGGDEEMQKQYKYAKQGANSITRRIYDSATMGAGDEIMAGISAAVETPFSRKTLGENYDRHLNVQRALRDDAKADLSGPAGLAADVTGGMMMLPGKALQAAAVAVPAAATWGAGLTNIGRNALTNTPALAKAGAAWGGGHAFLDTDGSTDPNASLADHAVNRLAAVPGGMVEGAVGGVVLGNALHGALGVRDLRRGIKAERIQGQQLARLDAEAEGVTPFGPAIVESRSAQRTGESLAGSVAGGSLRDGARLSIQQAEARAQQVLREQTSGAPSNDLGEGIQRSLDRNLYRSSIPSREVQGMDSPTLERYSGQVTPEGFRPPRPTVEPVRPRDVQEITPEQFEREGLPNRVKPVDPSPAYPDRDGISLSPELKQRQADHAMQIKEFNSRYETNKYKQRDYLDDELPYHKNIDELKLINKKIQEVNERFAKSWDNPELFPPRSVMSKQATSLVERRKKLEAELEPIVESHRTIQSEGKKLADEIESYRSAKYVKLSRDAHGEATRQAKTRTLQQNAAAETQYRRTQAEMDANRQTEAARDAANRSYDADLAANPSGFRVGRTRESYPTEFNAAYERVARETPNIQRNPLGGPNEPTRTSTEGLLNDFAADARRNNQASGYKDGKLFGVDGSVMHPGVASYLEEKLGADVARQIQALAKKRASGQFAPSIQGVRDLRTAVRRAADDLERPRMPGDMRTTDSAMLRRLEGSLTEDLHAFQQQAGPQGERSSGMMRAVDTEYRAVAELRRPLAKLMGNKSPVDAMNALVTAAEKGDTRTLSALMRVMTEKDNPVRAAAAIISHATDGAKDLNSFMKGFSNIRPESRAVLFRTPEGQALRASLERLERTMGSLAPYQQAIERGSGINFASKTNALMAITAIQHVYATALLFGGGVLTSRLMSSPRYVRWLTELPRSTSRGFGSPEAVKHLARLSAMANSDAKRGDEKLKALAEIALPGKATAAPLNPRSDTERFKIFTPATFAGEGSKTADKGKLEIARDLAAEGASPEDTWKATGWARSQDGKWRTEIDDSKSKMNPAVAPLIEQVLRGDNRQLPLGMVLQHAELFQAYPELRNRKVNFYTERSTPNIKGLSGYIDNETGDIAINANMAKKDPASLLATILHETQHDIQRKEKFDYGKNSGMGGLESYWSRPGEAESFDVENRKAMTKTERQDKVPSVIANRKKLDWGGGPIRLQAKGTQ